MKKVWLASASPRRKELLSQIDVTFEVLPSEAEENITSTEPGEVVKELSSLKCREVFERIDGEKIVIGADTVVAAEGKILGKPKDENDAFEMISMLQGNTHQVYTGVTVMILEEGKEIIRSFYEKTDVEFYPMTDEEIRVYIETKEPMDKAGAYGIQGKAAAYISRINGDYNNVVGLPVAALYQNVKEMGYDLRSGEHV